MKTYAMLAFKKINLTVLIIIFEKERGNYGEKREGETLKFWGIIKFLVGILISPGIEKTGPRG